MSRKGGAAEDIKGEKTWRQQERQRLHERIEKLLRDGLSCVVIQDRTGAGAHTVYAVAKALGLPLQRETQQKIKGLWL